MLTSFLLTTQDRAYFWPQGPNTPTAEMPKKESYAVIGTCRQGRWQPPKPSPRLADATEDATAAEDAAAV